MCTFTLHSLEEKRSSFSKYYQGKGTLHNFSTEKIEKPVAVFFRKKSKAVTPLDCLGTYSAQGKLKVSDMGLSISIPSAQEKWKKSADSHPIDKSRYFLKTKLQEHIAAHTISKKVEQFYTLLLTGKPSHYDFKKDFSKVNQSHILAISGFHFSLLTFLFTFLLSPFFQTRARACLSMGFVALYYFMVGDSPSVFRAFFTIWCFSSLSLMGKKTHPLNLLGLAALVYLSIFPTSLYHTGFILSYLATFGILVFFPLFSPLENLLKPLPHTLRLTLPLSLSVYVAITPFLLYKSHTFPLLGIPFCLFTPFFIVVLLYLLLLSCLFSPLFPTVFTYVDALVHTGTTALLDLLSTLPYSHTGLLMTNYFDQSSLWIFYTLLFLASAWQIAKTDEEPHYVF